MFRRRDNKRNSNTKTTNFIGAKVKSMETFAKNFRSVELFKLYLRQLRLENTKDINLIRKLN